MRSYRNLIVIQWDVIKSNIEHTKKVPSPIIIVDDFIWIYILKMVNFPFFYESIDKY